MQDGVGKDGVVSSSAGDTRQTGEERSDVISARCKDGQQRNISRACSASQCAHTHTHHHTLRHGETHEPISRLWGDFVPDLCQCRKTQTNWSIDSLAQIKFLANLEWL